jgi:arylsulfatase A-like enzyme
MAYYTGESDEKHYWEGYSAYAKTNDAISYIEQHANDENPFLIVLALAGPHFPHHTAPAELQKQFNPDELEIRANVPDNLKERTIKEAIGYYGHILALDSCMGMLQNAMDKSGLTENTILVFTSDHGEMMGSHGVTPRQKQVPWSESVRVPFLLRYPAKFGNKKVEVKAPINTPDILPTLLDLAGLPVPNSIEGESMAAAIKDEKAFKDKAALIMNVSPFARRNAKEYRGIYTSRYAYVKNLEGPWLLFDHEKDPLQMNNLVGKPGYEDLQEKMEEKLQKKLEEAGDSFRPREYYIEKWGYTLHNGLNIDISEGAEFQGPELNKSKDQ